MHKKVLGKDEDGASTGGNGFDDGVGDVGVVREVAVVETETVRRVAVLKLRAQNLVIDWIREYEFSSIN